MKFGFGKSPDEATAPAIIVGPADELRSRDDGWGGGSSGDLPKPNFIAGDL